MRTWMWWALGLGIASVGGYWFYNLNRASAPLPPLPGRAPVPTSLQDNVYDRVQRLGGRLGSWSSDGRPGIAQVFPSEVRALSARLAPIGRAAMDGTVTHVTDANLRLLEDEVSALETQL